MKKRHNSADNTDALIERIEGFIPAIWRTSSGRIIKGAVYARDWDRPYMTQRGEVCGFMTFERLDWAEMPDDAHVIVGLDVDYISAGDILSVKKEQITVKKP